MRPRPDDLPGRTASTRGPLSVEPAGNTTLPSTTTSSARVAVNVSPATMSSVLTSFGNVMRRVVPASTVVPAGVGAGRGVGEGLVRGGDVRGREGAGAGAGAGVGSGSRASSESGLGDVVSGKSPSESVESVDVPLVSSRRAHPVEATRAAITTSANSEVQVFFMIPPWLRSASQRTRSAGPRTDGRSIGTMVGAVQPPPIRTSRPVLHQRNTHQDHEPSQHGDRADQLAQPPRRRA